MAFSGALVRKSEDFSGDFTVIETTLDWDSEEYDVGSWHSAGSPARLTVPAGVSHVRLYATVYHFNGAASQNFTLNIRKNGGVWVAHHRNQTPTFTGSAALVTAPIPVVEGDYFEVQIRTAGDTSVTINASASYFAIEKVQPQLLLPFSGAMARKSADQTAANFTTQAAVPWDTTEYDVGGWFNAGQPNRLTVPAGVNYIRLDGFIRATLGGSNGTEIFFMKSGTESFYGRQRTDRGTANTYQQISSPPIPVVAGNYFELHHWEETDTSITIETESYFAAQKVG